LKQKKSILIKPLAILLDLFLINGIVYVISDKEYLNFIFLTYISISWLFISYYTKYYNIYRYTHISKLVTLSLSQIFIFSLAYLSYFSVFREGEIIDNQFLIYGVLISTLLFFKFFIFYLLKKYRSEGKNYRNIVLFGNSKSAKKIEILFQKKNDLGYRFFGFFSEVNSKSKSYLGTFKKSFDYILQNSIDEVYCDSSEITMDQLKLVREFAEKNKLHFRLMPENKAVYSKDLILEYYGTTPILKPKPLPFEKFETHIIKRVFDIIFSFFICLIILSWLLPILWIIIRLDSKGSLFFIQKRDGLNGKQFNCYKLRSMKSNSNLDKMSTTKNDKRVTKVGAFLRKTSLDEMPQFFNVLKGDMSVVGPRPHVNFQTKKYVNEVTNYTIRNSVKPGITGLAQISGYRGEVIKKSDIENRVRLDIFYIESWSFFLDIKIILQTFFNTFLKEEKAY